MNSHFLSACLLALALQCGLSEAHEHHHHLREAMKNFLIHHSDIESHGTLLDYITLNLLPSAFGFQPANINGSYSENRDFLMHDVSNEDIAFATTQEIIERSGFNYTNHYVTSEDGYVTQLIRIINPLADQTKLRKYPVVLFHGGLVDSAIYVAPSSNIAHPEKYPRGPEDGPVTSNGRAIGFLLANNGFDVWLVGTRGANEQNTDRDPSLRGEGAYPSTEYWSFKMDDISQREVERQVDKVLKVSGAERADVMGYSLSTMLTMQAFAGNPEFARNKVNTYVLMAPPVNIDGSSRLTNFLVRDLCVKVSLKVGINTLSKVITTSGTRKLMHALLTNHRIRYTVGKLLTIAITGSSGQYRTNLEPAVYSKIFQGTGFGEMQQWCQQAVARRYQKFDYGPTENLRRYGSVDPPAYNVSQDLGYNYLYLISGGTDNLAPISSVNQVVDSLLHKPDEHNFIPNYSHLDLVAGVDNEQLVNIPLLNFLSSHQ